MKTKLHRSPALHSLWLGLHFSALEGWRELVGKLGYEQARRVEIEEQRMRGPEGVCVGEVYLVPRIACDE